MADYSDIKFIAQQKDYIARLETLRMRAEADATEIENARAGAANLLAQLNVMIAAAVQKTGLDANLPAANFRITGAGQAVGGSDYTTLSQVNSIAATGGSPSSIGITEFNKGTATANQFIRINPAGNAVIGDSRRFVRKFDDYTAIAGDKIFADTFAGTWDFNLPTNPSDGDEVTIADFRGGWHTFPLRVWRSGEKIMGLEESMDLNVRHLVVTLVYRSAIADWRFG